MTAPAATARVAPASATQIDLHDGYSTVITLDPADADMAIFERVVPPPGMEGGDPIDTTTMHNSVWRTFRARQLKTLTPITVVGGYDPIMFDISSTSPRSVFSLINVETTITVTFPDGSTLAFFGFTQTFAPQDNVEGEYPTANVTVVPTNWDPVGKVEEGPVFSNVSGT